MEKQIWNRGQLASPHTQPDKARRVQDMFDRIAPTYELVNRVLSAGRDASWRRRAVELANIRPDDRVLDLACGTGDFARSFVRAGPASIVGSDFAERMLTLAASRKSETIRWCRADALALPFSDACFTVVSCAFGVRNFQDLEGGLREIYRVLEMGGRAVILEFTMPKSRILGAIYQHYLQHVLPVAARIISRDRSGAYDYLPQSVETFVDTSGMIRYLRSVGFNRIVYRPLSIGIVTVYVGRKM